MATHTHRERLELLSMLRQMSELREDLEDIKDEIADININLSTVRDLKCKLGSAEKRVSEELKMLDLSITTMESELVLKPVLYVTNELELMAVWELKNLGFKGIVEVMAKGEEKEDLEKRAEALGLKRYADR